MATLDEIRRHVCADAHELAATTGLVLPLLEDLNSNKEEHGPHFFLRQHLARHVALVIVRLHEAPDTRAKGMRVIASIRSLLNYAKAEKRLTHDHIANFVKRREALIATYEAHGESFHLLRDFRHTELAHSIHVAGQSSAQLLFSPLWDLAHDTFELVLEIESQLVQGGSARIVDLDGKFDEWRNRGENFWSSRL